MLNKAILLACTSKKEAESLGRFKGTVSILALPDVDMYSIENISVIEGDFVVASLAFIANEGFGMFITSLLGGTFTIKNETNGESVSVVYSSANGDMHNYALLSGALFNGINDGQECVFAIYE